LLLQVAGLQIARIQFGLKVARHASPPKRLQSRLKRHSSAYASYAETDRNVVVGRVLQLARAVPDLDVFVDVDALRGQPQWERELKREIDNRDVFYLFWSDAASKSEEVGREWRTALQLRGVEYLSPVPLAANGEAPLPPELQQDGET
ncbi:MAG: toll/interleukin-1 receptor domain-containing protein, partial [Planctomycetales bacterium]